VTSATTISELEEAWKVAIRQGQSAAAVSAIMNKAKMAGLLTDRLDNSPARASSFDGNYTEAVRRIALLLHLAEEEQSDGGNR
jgi:hypothetical protein